jgi:hypothetical protein
MSDPYDPEVSVETTHGDRPSSSAGDRLVVALAILALVAGGLIGISRLLPPGAEAADASATPLTRASQAATPQNADDSPLRTLTVSSAENWQGPPRAGSQVGWGRALGRLTVRQAPNQMAATVGEFEAGDAMSILDDSRGGTAKWLEVVAPMHGWFLARNAHGAPSIRRFTQHGLDTQFDVDTVFAAQGQFLIGAWSTTSQSYALGLMRDGNTWQRTDPPPGTDYVRAAYGPRHWVSVALSYAAGKPRMWMWQSDDGASWSSLGDASSLIPAAGLAPMQLVGSPRGYVMTPFHAGSGRTPPRVMFSADAMTWAEEPTPVGPDELVAAEIGFYAYSTNASERPVAGFSTSGTAWTTVDTSQLSGLLGVAGAGDRFVALDHVGDLVRPWSASVEGGTLVWRRDQASEAAFAGSVVTSVSGDSTAIATGWERDTEIPLWWSHDAAGWHRHVLPSGFRGLPRQAAASDGRYVVVGGGAGPLHQSPIIWASSDEPTNLQPEATPFLATQRSADAATCAEYNADLLDMLMNSGLAYAECRGDADLAFRAFVVLCQGCGPVTPAEENAATWLAQPDPRRTLRLAPVHTGEWGSLEAVLAPRLEVRSEWANRWVTVTGHFDDPAAGSCRVSPQLFGERDYPGRDQVIRDCRGRFVITRVRLED